MKRLSAIDGLRGLVVILMVMHHTLDAWVREPERHGNLWIALRHLGGVPAPGFLLLAGLSAALVDSRSRRKGTSALQRAEQGIRRGLYILGIGFTFRVAMFVVDGNKPSDWAMLFRVDILNCMGVSLALLAAVCSWPKTRNGVISTALIMGAVFLLPTPFLFGHPITLPSSFIGNYLAGTQLMSMFPLFPWLSVAAAGIAVGEYLGDRLSASSDPNVAANRLLADATYPLLATGLCLFAGGISLGRIPGQFYPPHSYWSASPIYVVMRVGIQLALLGLFGLLWRKDAEGKRGEVLQLLGRHSLLVYLVHLEFAYGRLAGPFKGQMTVLETFAGDAVILAGFAAVSWALERRQARSKGPASVTVAPQLAGS